MNLLCLTLSLSLLPPAAHEHNERAMAHDEAGRLDQAADELTAAYAAMPDPRADLAGREQVLGSLRGVFLRQHRQTNAAQPLCRLRGLLREHVAALQAAYPDQPGRLEISGNRERLAAVETQLAGFPPDACEPPAPPPRTAQPAQPTPPPARPVAPAPANPPPPDGPTARQLNIAGGVTLGLGAALLGVMTYGLVVEQRQAAAGRQLSDAIGDRPISRDEFVALHDHLDRARFSKTLALGTGISSAIFSLFSVALLVTASHKKSKTNNSTTVQNGVSLAPWRLSGGAGVTLRVPLP